MLVTSFTSILMSKPFPFFSPQSHVSLAAKQISEPRITDRLETDGMCTVTHHLDTEARANIQTFCRSTQVEKVV